MYLLLAIVHNIVNPGYKDITLNILFLVLFDNLKCFPVYGAFQYLYGPPIVYMTEKGFAYHSITSYMYLQIFIYIASRQHNHPNFWELDRIPRHEGWGIGSFKFDYIKNLMTHSRDFGRPLFAYCLGI